MRTSTLTLSLILFGALCVGPAGAGGPVKSLELSCDSDRSPHLFDTVKAMITTLNGTRETQVADRDTGKKYENVPADAVLITAIGKSCDREEQFDCHPSSTCYPQRGGGVWCPPVCSMRCVQWREVRQDYTPQASDPGFFVLMHNGAVSVGGK